MDWKDVVTVLAGGLVILIVAFVVKPALLAGMVSESPPVKPLYVQPAPVPEVTPFPEDSPVYTTNFRWTSISGSVYTTEVRVPEALFEKHRETPRFDTLAWGRYALDAYDRPILKDLALRIAPPTNNPEKEYFRLMDIIFFVQQIPYALDNETESYRGEVLPPHVMHKDSEVEYPKYPTETLVDGKGDCEDSAILMAGLLDTLGYDTVLLRYPDHMVVGIQMEEFDPYYARYTPRYFAYGGKHYYHVEGTDFDWTYDSDNSTIRIGKPSAIGDTSGTSGTPEIIPLRYTPAPVEYRIRQVSLPAEGV